jgi:hypothetical protein
MWVRYDKREAAGKEEVRGGGGVNFRDSITNHKEEEGTKILNRT